MLPYRWGHTKIVCIIDFDKSGDDEITDMVKEIAAKKKAKGYKVITVKCRDASINDSFKISATIKQIPVDTTQLIIAAHSRFYTRNGAVAPLKPYSKNEDVRHIGEYQLEEVSHFLTKILLDREKIEEIKFYSCETAVNKSTYDTRTYGKKIPKPVETTELNKIDAENITKPGLKEIDAENIKSYPNFTEKTNSQLKKSQGLAKGQRALKASNKEETEINPNDIKKTPIETISIRVKKFILTNENFDELKALKEQKKFDLLSNIQMVMIDVYTNVFPKKERTIHFQGINGVAFFDVNSTSKMKSFDQKYLEQKDKPDFETSIVDKKETVDKIDYQFTLGEKPQAPISRPISSSDNTPSRTPTSSGNPPSPRKRKH